MMCTVRLLILLIYYGPIASLESEKRRLTARIGETVVLQPEIPNLKTDDQFLWSFHSNSRPVKSIIVQSQVLKGEVHTEYKGRFKDSLLLDRNTGSLTIRNITTSQSGQYHLQIFGDESDVSDWYISCSVYAPVSAPDITSRGNSHPNTRTITAPVGRALSKPESQSSSSCQVLCSVKNDREVSLSWFRGNEILNQTSSPDAGITLSLPLDIDDQDNITYRCVSANPVSNYTTHLNTSVACSYKNEKDPPLRKLWYLLISFSLCVTIVIVALTIYLKTKKEDNNRGYTDQTPEDPHYADLKHRGRTKGVRIQETEQTCETIYAGVVT